MSRSVARNDTNSRRCSGVPSHSLSMVAMAQLAQWEPVLVLGPNPVLILSFYTHGRRQTAVDGDYDRHDEGITTFVL